MYCPEWLFGCSAAYTAKGFLSSESSLNGIARKFSKGLSEKYKEINFEELSETAEGILQFLSEIEAGEEAVNYIDQYIFKRIYYLNNGSERKLSGLFASPTNPEKTKEYAVQKSVKVFRATVFGVRNDTMPKAPPGWNINELKDNDNLNWYVDLVLKPVDITDNF